MNTDEGQERLYPVDPSLGVVAEIIKLEATTNGHRWTRMRINCRWISMDPDVDGGLSKEIIGFLEKVHENALVHELSKTGLQIDQQKLMSVRYDGISVGDYKADIVVDSKIVVELKVAPEITNIHEAQLLNYLRASGIRIGLILNFGLARIGIRRMVV